MTGKFGDHRQLVRSMILHAAVLSEQKEQLLADLWEEKSARNPTRLEATNAIWATFTTSEQGKALLNPIWHAFDFMDSHWAAEASREATIARIFRSHLSPEQYKALSEPWDALTDLWGDDDDL